MKVQSMVEVVVALGIVALVITGMVMLMTTSLGTKTKGFDRNKAVEMSGAILEQMVEKRNADPTQFWDINSAYWTGILGNPLTLPNYPGYTYTVTFNQSGDCGADCREAKVTITWVSPSDKAVFTRLFTKF